MSALTQAVDPNAPVDFQSRVFAYRHHADQRATSPARHPVVVVGAGPVGLALAIDLALQGVRVVLLDNDDRLSSGSRAICFAKRTLEVFDRLGCGDRMTDKGVSWNVGKVFFRDEEIYRFDLLPEPDHHRPAFINLQQYYVEGYLAERAAELPLIDIRWKNTVSGVDQFDDHALLTIDTPDGPYRLAAEYVAACDGSRSAVRRLIGQESKGRVFKDRFLIADIRMTADFPAERWFWFDPPFHPNQSVLLHRQPDNVWRIDWQLGWDADPDREKQPEHIIPRVKALLGESAEFELQWASVYTFACLRMDRFRHGRVIFAGDSAHGVSPFGARGANSGVQDAENLAWKLAYVVQGRAGQALLDTYSTEREYAADENIRNSTRSTDFITPKSDISRLFRDATLDLAKHHPFARSLVNSGRLSVPAHVLSSTLNTPMSETVSGRMVPGAPADDAPIEIDGRAAWLLQQLRSGEFTLLVFDGPQAAEVIASARAAAGDRVPVSCVLVAAADSGANANANADAGAASPVGARLVVDHKGLVARRYDGQPGTVVLLRPDQHVCAVWRQPNVGDIAAALSTALALS